MTYETTVPLEEIVEWKIVWHRLFDACEKCKQLANYEFSGVGDPPQILVHPTFGPVWDITADIPLTHPHCRCTIVPYVRVNWNKAEEIKRVSEQFGIYPIAQKEWMELSGIQEYTEQVKGLRINVGELRGEYQQLEYLLYRFTSVAGRAGLPSGIDAALRGIQTGALTGRMIQHSALQMGTGTPYGFALGILGLISVPITLALVGKDIVQGQIDEEIKQMNAKLQQETVAYQLEMRRIHY